MQAVTVNGYTGTTGTPGFYFRQTGMFEHVNCGRKDPACYGIHAGFGDAFWWEIMAMLNNGSLHNRNAPQSQKESIKHLREPRTQDMT